MGKFEEALKDADLVIRLRPNWPKVKENVIVLILIESTKFSVNEINLFDFNCILSRVTIVVLRR